MMGIDRAKKPRVFAAIASLAVCIMAILALAPASAHASDWPLSHADAYNSGVTTDAGPLSLNGSYWDRTLGSGINMFAGIDVEPVVGDGKVYVVSYNGSVYAFYLNGTPAWKNTVLGGQDSFIIGNPAYHDHVLYIVLWLGNSSADTGVHAIDTDDGSLAWSNNELPKCQPVTPILYDDGMIYFGTWQKHTAYYGVNATTGAIAWERNSTSGGGYYWAGASAAGNYLVYGDDAGHVTSVNKKTGELADDLNVSDTFDVNSEEIRSSIVYDENENSIFFSSQGGYAYSLGFNKTTGKFEPSKKWNTYVEFSTSTPAIYDGRLYVGAGTFSTGGKVYCLSEANGSVIWAYATNGGVQSSPTISVIDGNPYVYFTSNCANGTAYCLDGSGKLLWSFTPPESKAQYLLCGVAISGGWAFFGNDAGYLFAIGAGQNGGASATGEMAGQASASAAKEAGNPYVSFLLAILSLSIGMAAYILRRSK
jgi:outer membrane protein assembly factor BamB